MYNLFTSESVSEGHPDKIADQISDAILDAYLAVDPEAKVACETFVTHDEVIVAGEISSKFDLSDQVEPLVRQVISEIGYDELSGYGPERYQVRNKLHQQSSEINKAVADGGAGDQGIMFGYASDETPELMPKAIQLSHELLKQLSALRKKGILGWLLPDAKSQVTLQYNKAGQVEQLETIVLSTQHMATYEGEALRQEQLAEALKKHLLNPLLKEDHLSENLKLLINPSGSFVIGGPVADTGLTGRKIIVDTYGGSAPHGGGAFSGKDPTKVDRSAAYAARYIAKNLVAAGICRRVTVQLSYAIGVAEPTSLLIDTHGTAQAGISDEQLLQLVRKIFPLKPNDIIDAFGLRAPIYRETAAYGHMGRKHERVVKRFKDAHGKLIEREVVLFGWEQTDKAEKIKQMLSSAQ